MGRRKKRKKKAEARDTLPAPPPSEPANVIVESSPGLPPEVATELERLDVFNSALRKHFGDD